MKYTIRLKCIGQSRLGVNDYGISIAYKEKQFDFLAQEAIFANAEEPQLLPLTDQSKNEEILVIKGATATYLLNLETEKASLYKHTIRTKGGVWCEEYPIYGNQPYHFITKSGGHFQVQFPFVPFAEFLSAVADYKELRMKQIEQAKQSYPPRDSQA